MAFDLYGSPAPVSKETPEPVSTSLDTLAAATWIQVSDDRWRMCWKDHCDYPDPCVEDNENHFVCELYIEDGNWIYDWMHTSRGGEQERNELDFDGPHVESAQSVMRSIMEGEMDQWITSCEEAMAARDDEDEDY